MQQRVDRETRRDGLTIVDRDFSGEARVGIMSSLVVVDGELEGFDDEEGVLCAWARAGEAHGLSGDTRELGGSVGWGSS